MFSSSLFAPKTRMTLPRIIVVAGRSPWLMTSAGRVFSTASACPTAVTGTEGIARDDPGANKKRLRVDTMSDAVVNMQYAVRGQVVIAADKISDEIARGGDGAVTGYPFSKIVYTNSASVIVVWRLMNESHLDEPF